MMPADYPQYIALGLFVVLIGVEFFVVWKLRDEVDGLRAKFWDARRLVSAEKDKEFEEGKQWYKAELAKTMANWEKTEEKRVHESLAYQTQINDLQLELDRSMENWDKLEARRVTEEKAYQAKIKELEDELSSRRMQEDIDRGEGNRR